MDEVYLRWRVQKAIELMLHDGGISWNIPGQHWHTEVHGLLEQRELLLTQLSEMHEENNNGTLQIK